MLKKIEVGRNVSIFCRNHLLYCFDLSTLKKCFHWGPPPQFIRLFGLYSFIQNAADLWNLRNWEMEGKKYSIYYLRRQRTTSLLSALTNKITLAKVLEKVKKKSQPLFIFLVMIMEMTNLLDSRSQKLGNRVCLF